MVTTCSIKNQEDLLGIIDIAKDKWLLEEKEWWFKKAWKSCIENDMLNGEELITIVDTRKVSKLAIVIETAKHGLFQNYGDLAWKVVELEDCILANFRHSKIWWLGSFTKMTLIRAIKSNLRYKCNCNNHWSKMNIRNHHNQVTPHREYGDPRRVSFKTNWVTT